MTTKIVSDAPGVKTLATASRSVSLAHEVEDCECLTVDEVVAAAELVVAAVKILVSVDFGKRYPQDVCDSATQCRWTD